MTRVVVGGGTGRLGSLICAGVAAADDLVLAGRVARSLAGAEDGWASIGEALAAAQADVLIDVSAPAIGEAHALAGVEAGLPVVLGTTGVEADGMARIDAAAREAGVPVLYVPNFAITAVLMMRLAAEAAKLLPDCAIVEEHHPAKKDHPSGTARRTADMVEEVAGTRPPISSIRLEGVVANQSVLFGAEAQTLEIRHVTTGRSAFVPGALLAIRGVGALGPGLHAGLEHVLD